MARFKTRARTVEMLGRQQIANASTAISELFKNAHDAYADHVEVDYFRSDDLMVIRDDGVGMTLEEFEDKWLVLGTESKFAQDGTKVKTHKPPGKPERTIMGEKGIGRLAIALLGRQVLILTRAKRGKKSHDLVMCFIHWGVFEIPRINLEDIEIPVKVISGSGIPTINDVHELIKQLRDNLKGLSRKEKGLSIKEILNDLANINLDPEDLDHFLDGPSLKNGQGGTHFYVVPADEGMALDIDRDRREERKDFSKFLLGFSNSVFRESPPPPIKAAFRYWPNDESPEDDLIGPGEFFTKQELRDADHRIRGRFDEYGQFRGKIRIYNELISNHVIPWAGGQNKPTSCGPFEIEFGYIMGTQRETSLPPDTWQRLVRRLDRIGGLYVYRDRIRILPYGNSDVDWIHIEERRSKGAGYYFFSYRRLFGAVKLSRKENGKLKEKAGREGFQQDKAYRQLKDILENFFMQLATDFFRKDGEYTEYYDEQREDLGRQEEARRQREKQASAKRKNISANLENFFQRINDGAPQTEVANLKKSIQQRMKAVASLSDPEQASVALLDVESDAYEKLAGIRESYRLDRPRGVGLSRSLQREWDAYLAEVQRLDAELFDPFVMEVVSTLGQVARKGKLYIDQQQRLNKLIKQKAGDRSRLIKKEARDVRNSAVHTRNVAIKVARNAIKDVKETISSVEAEFLKQNINDLSEAEIEKLREDLEKQIVSVSLKNQDNLTKIRDMLITISENISQDTDIMESDMIEAMDQELQELREQTEADAEMVQLGLSVAIINHEFETAIKGIRRSLRELRPWANSNPDLSELYQDIRNNFEHLDGHLNLFVPLQRRLYRKKIAIKGSDIDHYIRTLFEIRLKRHNVQLSVSDEFLDAEILGFPSTIYPVFVNVFDNAIFWLDSTPKDREIRLDAGEDGFLISNNGPPIKSQDRLAVFEQGFTRKPGGRGLGLFISKKALQKEGMNIEVLSSSKSKGTSIKNQLVKR